MTTFAWKINQPKQKMDYSKFDFEIKINKKLPAPNPKQTFTLCTESHLPTSLSLIQFMLHGVLTMADMFPWQYSIHSWT